MLVASCYGGNPPKHPFFLSPKVKVETSVWVTSATHEQRNTKGTTRPDLSLQFLSPLYLQPLKAFPHLHHPKFYRSGGTFQIRAILRSETDRIVLERQGFTEESNPGLETHSRRFGRDIIRHAINPSDFIRDAGGYFPKHIRWEIIPTQEGMIPGQIAKHKWSDQLGKGPRTKTPHDCRHLTHPPPCGNGEGGCPDRVMQ